MARGIIYCMTTIVPGLIKIGKTGVDNFEQRMYSLESNGYRNIAGLKRRFAIEVDDFDEKEALLHDIFSKSNVPNTELFALDADLVVQLLSSLDGKQIFPQTLTKEEVFDMATDERCTGTTEKTVIPDGDYYADTKNGKATLRVKNSVLTVLKGSSCAPCHADWMPKARRDAKIKDGILQEDVDCKSLSTAGWVVLGRANSGWFTWKTRDGKPLDIYRSKDVQ